MFRNRIIVSLVFALMCLAGVWLAATGLAAPRLSASEGLAPLTFKSPLGDPQLSLAKHVNNNAPQAGDVITYVLTYSNTRAGSEAYNVRLYDFLPAGVQFMSSNPPAASFMNGALLFTAPSITSSVGAPQNTKNVKVTVRVLEGYDGVYNHSLLSADCVTPTAVSLLKSVVQPPVSLKLTKIGYSYVLTDGVLAYTLRTRNDSDVLVNDVAVVDVLPTGLPLVQAAPQPEEKILPMLRWSQGDLGPGEGRTIMFTTTAPSHVGVITNTALADARQRVMTQTLFATHVVTQGAILRVTKSGSAPAVRPGDQLVYTLRYWNDGNELATAVRLTDTLPANVTLTGAYPPPAINTNQQVVWTLGVISPTIWGEPPGEVVITITVEVPGNRILHNVANITGRPTSSTYQAYPEHYELDTPVGFLLQYLPIITKKS